MEVTGLPVALGTSLNALLSKNSVSSWKIVGGEAETTVVVLRLKPQAEPGENNMACRVDSKTGGEGLSRQQHYRSKPPSSIRRDQERNRRHRERLQASRQQQQLQGDTFYSNDIFDRPSLSTHVSGHDDPDRPAGVSSLHANPVGERGQPSGGRGKTGTDCTFASVNDAVGGTDDAESVSDNCIDLS